VVVVIAEEETEGKKKQSVRSSSTESRGAPQRAQTLEALPPCGGGSARRPKRTRGEREELVGDKKTDSTQINLNKTSSGNPRSTSNQSSKPCTVLQYPSRNAR